jgi:hypothetical protein
MSSLTQDQKQLLFDYAMGLASEKDTESAQILISSDKNASELHATLKAALSPLDSIQPEPCPDQLVEGTIWRLKQLADSGQVRLEQLLADEQTQAAVRAPLWSNLGRFVSIAAVLLIAVSVWFSSTTTAKEKYRQWQCQRNLARIWQGIQLYRADNNDKMPAVATAAGSPWWKVGYQGNENHSTTRNMWLLAKGNYVKPKHFNCPGSVKATPIKLQRTQLQQYNDFPGRTYVTYSFRIPCKQTTNKSTNRKVLIADLSPLFENLPEDYSRQLKLELSKEQLTLNSINHNRRGQNVMYCDGTIQFIKSRHATISNDDIFTLRNITVYQGSEVPDCDTDIFVAP